MAFVWFPCSVCCVFFLQYSCDFPVVQAQRHMPMHLRRKMKQEKKKPLHFEILPPNGSLLPGQRVNIQVKFMPTEEVSANHSLWVWVEFKFKIEATRNLTITMRRIFLYNSVLDH